MFQTYTNTFQPRRDHQFERDAVQDSCLDLAIRNSWHDAKIRGFMPAAFADDGNPVLCNHQLRVYLRRPYSLLAIPDMSWPFPIQRECQPVVELYHDTHPAVVNADPRMNAAFPMLRLAQLGQRLSAPPPPPATLASSWDAMDRLTGHDLGACLGLTGGWGAVAPADGPWTLMPSCLLNQNPGDIPVRDALGDFRYLLHVFQDGVGVYAILPLSFRQHPDYPAPLKLFIPPRPPYTFMGCQRLREFPNATVILTDDVWFALTAAPTPEQLVLGNPGGDAWVENLDVEPLRGRRVVCHAAMEGQSPEAQRKAGQSLMLLVGKLASLGITPGILPPQEAASAPPAVPVPNEP